MLKKMESQNINGLLQEQSVSSPGYRKIKDIEEGEYVCYKYAMRMYRKNVQTILYLEKENIKCKNCSSYIEDRYTYWKRCDAYPDCPRQKPKYVWVWGSFLQQELDKLDLDKMDSPLRIKVGIWKTTKQNKKDRLVSVVRTPASEDLVGLNKYRQKLILF